MRNSLQRTLRLVALATQASWVSAFSTLVGSPRSSIMVLNAETLASTITGTTTANTSDTKAEEVVRRYFDGVNKKDPVQLRSCFGETATIRDVCGLDSSTRSVPSDNLVDRCMEFVTAHPDCLVRFHYGPSEERKFENLTKKMERGSLHTGMRLVTGRKLLVESTRRILQFPWPWRVKRGSRSRNKRFKNS